MTTRRRKPPPEYDDALRVTLSGPSTTPGILQPKMSGSSSPRRRVRRRRASPLGGARLYGLQTPVSLTLTLHVRADVWLEVRAPNGRFFVNEDCSVLSLMRQIIEGGHWVRDEGSTRKRT